jgi:multidrug resistance efflux pump
MVEEKDIELKTEEVNELLTAIPSWMIRWGITTVFILLLVILSLSFFIKYPDKLTAQSVITTINPPVTLVAKSTGKIFKLNARNSQQVRQGDVLMVIENAANYRDVLNVMHSVDLLQKNIHSKVLPEIQSYDSLNLGDLTPAYLAYVKSYNDYKLQLDVRPQEKEIELLNLQLEEYQGLQTKYQTQENIYREEFELIEKDYQRFKTLFSGNFISAKEFEDKKREYLSAKRNYEGMKITKINNKLTISNLEKNKLQLQMQAYQELEKFKQGLNQSIQTLKSQIETWEQTYLLKAPIDGTVSLFSFWTVNQNIRQGDEVLSVVPIEKQEMIAKLTLPLQNSGKLKVGQKVNIKLNNYQFQEYGMLKGKVKAISDVPQKNAYAIEVALPNELTTTYNKHLDYKEEMQGVADIITEDLSVFERVFQQFRKILKK